jgi:hypothetical protein
MKNIKLTGLLTMLISLTISLVSGFCTVVGMGKVFTSAAAVTMFIAAVIEVGRVVLLYDLHHFWHKLKWFQKLPGLMMLLIAMTLSAMGVYGFFADAHSHRTQEVLPIEMVIQEKESEIKILEDAIKVNEDQLKQFDGKAFNKYTEMGYVTKAVNLQKEQQKVTNKLYDDNRVKQQEITKIKKEILDLQLDAEKKSPTLAHLKYYAKLFDVDDDTAIIIFIVMIMTVFDTLAMYLMITADWINTIDYKKEDEEVVVKNATTQPITITEKVDLSNIEKELEELKASIKPIEIKDVKEYDDTKLFAKLDKLQSMMNNEDLVKRLTELEDKINTKNNIDTNEENDVLLDKVMDSIDENEDVILTQAFSQFIKEKPSRLKSLKKHYIDNPSVMSKLKQL